jgi:hypothetical protein
MEKKTKEKQLRTTVVTSADDEIISSKNKKRKLSSEKESPRNQKQLLMMINGMSLIFCGNVLTKFYLSHHFLMGIRLKNLSRSIKKSKMYVN